MKDKKNKLKHDILNCITILKANLEQIKDDGMTKDAMQDMQSCLEEIEEKLPQLIAL